MALPAISAIDVVLPVIIAYAGWRVAVVYNAFKAYGKPDKMPAFAPLSLPGVLFERGLTWAWEDRETVYGDKDCLRLTPWLWGSSVLYIRAPNLMRLVVGGGSNTTWIKPHWASGALMMMGSNVASENLDAWRRHRRIMQPFFNKTTFEFVWRETTRIYQDMVTTERWGQEPGSVVEIKSVNQKALKLGLSVIGSCGFGLASKFTWAEPKEAMDGKGTVQSNLKGVEENLMALLAAPKWIWKLPIKSLQATWSYYTSLLGFFHEELGLRKEIVNEALQNGGEDAVDSISKDIFTRLVLASQSDGKSGLSDDELLGNCWVSIIAGHDTTSSSIAAALALLAVHKEEQEKVYQEVTQVVEEAGGLDQLAYGKFPHTTGLFLESVRLYPAGYVGIRTSLEDTVLPTKSKDYILPRGSDVIVDFIGLEYNPAQFKDPTAFNPSRWIGLSEDAATAFSSGARECLGKKFALTEAVCFLAHLLKDWRVEPMLNPGETAEQWGARILSKIDIVLTLSIANVPVRLIHR